MEIHYEDGAIDFKCDTCGKRSRTGYIEESMLKQTEDKRGRERAETNRSRYRRERWDELEDQMKSAQEDPGLVPDPTASFHDILSPGYEARDDGEKYEKVHFDKK